MQISLDKLPNTFDGTLSIENHFYDTDLQQCEFIWRVVRFSEVFAEKAKVTEIAKGIMKSPSIAPGAKGHLKIPLPGQWKKGDALQLTAKDPHGREIMHWSWAIPQKRNVATSAPASPQLIQGDDFIVNLGKGRWSFSSTTGQLLSVTYNGQEVGLKNGPKLYTAFDKGKTLDSQASWSATAKEENSSVTIHAKSDDNQSKFTWIFKNNGEVELSYEYPPIKEKLVHCAVGFDLDEKLVKSKRWLGDGPYRISSNRRQGPQFGLWQNEYNDGLAGFVGRWQLPEFKSVFANIEWMRLDLQSEAKLLLKTNDIKDVGVLRPFLPNVPKKAKDGTKNARWNYPKEGGLYLFHKVPAIGTKFKPSSQLGPSSQPKLLKEMIQGTCTFLIK